MVPQTAVRSSIGDKTTRLSRNNSIAYMHRSNKFCPVSSACPAVRCDLSSMKLLSFAVQLLSKLKLRSLNRNIWWCRFKNITIVRTIMHRVRQWIFFAKVIHHQGRKVTCKRAKAISKKLKWLLIQYINKLYPKIKANRIIHTFFYVSNKGIKKGEACAPPWMFSQRNNPYCDLLLNLYDKYIPQFAILQIIV